MVFIVLTTAHTKLSFVYVDLLCPFLIMLLLIE